MYVAIPVHRDGSLAAVVRTSIPVTAINEAVGAIRQKIVIAVLVVTGLLAVVSLWFSARIGRPSAADERRSRTVRPRRVRPSAAPRELRGNQHFGRGDERHGRTTGRTDSDHPVPAERAGGGAQQHGGRRAGGGQRGSHHQRQPDVRRACSGMEPGELKGRSVHEVVRKPDLLEFVESSLSQYVVGGRRHLDPRSGRPVAQRARHGASRCRESEDRAL